MNNNNFFYFIVGVLITSVISISFFVAYKNFTSGRVMGDKIPAGNLLCVSAQETKFVTGNSLRGLIENGTSVDILKNYYDCNPVERGDIINYQYAKNQTSIIKIAKGLPGDNFSLKKSENSDLKYNIYINNEVVKTSFGDPYELTAAQKSMLELYEHNYQGVIPENNYLIMGNLKQGSLDSTKFGLISKNGIIGKVIIP